jgi:hypothetical protein
MRDSRSFFAHYRKYRALLLRFMGDHGIVVRPGVDSTHLIDVIHAMWLNHNFDQGVLNHAVRALLDPEVAPLPERRSPLPIRPVGDGDLVHPRPGGRRYLWRREVVRPEPQAEISISAAEIARVDDQLDLYFGDAPR